MSRLFLVAGLLALAFGIAAPSPADARQSRQWVQLGSQIASFKKDRDVIEVGRQAGAFNRIRLKVRRNSIFIRRIKIVFGGGDEQVVRMRSLLPVNVETSAIRLNGGVRHIDRIELFYQSAGLPIGPRGQIIIGNQGRAGRALVEVWGEQVITRPDIQSRGWQMLARAVVNPVWKEEIVRVGVRAGRFKTLVLVVRRNPIIIRRFVVIYGNDERHRVDLPRRINADRRSDRIALKGGRHIKEVRMIYRTRQNSFGRAIVELWAEPGKRQVRPPPPVVRLPRGWVPLGVGIAEFDRDRDTIKVGKEKGRFDKVVFRVRRANVYIRRITVVYGNGEEDRVRIRELVRADSRQRTLDLKGSRFVREIVLRYRTPDDAPRRARVHVFGQHPKGWRGAGRPPTAKPGPIVRQDGWVLLGRQKAGLGVDRDVIRVGRQFGQFRQVRLDVRGKGRRGVRVYDVKVIYGNGEVDNIFVPNKIPLGGSSGPLDLQGRRRTIEEVQLVYRTRLNLFGETQVEIWGRR